MRLDHFRAIAVSAAIACCALVVGLVLALVLVARAVDAPRANPPPQRTAR